MQHEKRKWKVEAEKEKSTEPLLKADYPWNPRAALHAVDSTAKPALRKASREYRALLQNRETD